MFFKESGEGDLGSLTVTLIRNQSVWVLVMKCVIHSITLQTRKLPTRAISGILSFLLRTFPYLIVSPAF